MRRGLRTKAKHYRYEHRAGWGSRYNMLIDHPLSGWYEMENQRWVRYIDQRGQLYIHPVGFSSKLVVRVLEL